MKKTAPKPNGVPTAAAPVPDQQQAAYDIVDAMARFRKLEVAIQKRDGAEEAMRQAQRQLRTARQRFKEANWDLAALLHAERRKGGGA